MAMPDMDKAAEEAAKELEKLDPEAVKAVATWWSQHYLKAGHKRLGRKLVAYIPNQEIKDVKELMKD